MTIKISELSHSIQGKLIFQDINLEIEEASFHSVVGLSGVGKSQLIRSLAYLNEGLSKTDSARKVRVSFQNNNLVPWLSAEKNVEIASNFAKPQRDLLFKEFGLQEDKNKRPSELSGGMQQRVGLIRALAGEAELLLLDEPFSMLDSQNKIQNQNYLMNYWKKHRCTILLVTHDIEEALFLSQKIHLFSKAEKTLSKTYVVERDYPRTRSALRSDPYFQGIFEDINTRLESEFAINA